MPQEPDCPCLSVKVLNGTITVHEIHRMYTNARGFQTRLYLSCLTDNEFADMHMTKGQIEELILVLRSVVGG